MAALFAGHQTKIESPGFFNAICDEEMAVVMRPFLCPSVEFEILEYKIKKFGINTMK